MSKDAYFFKHDSNARNDMKLVKARRKYKMSAHGIYFALLEMLREQSDHKLPTDDIPDIAFDFNEPVEKVTSIIHDFKLFIIENGYFFSQSFLQRMSEYNEQKAKRIAAGKTGGKASAAKKSKQTSSKRRANVEQTLTDAQAIDYTILDYIRVDYTKQDKTKEFTKGAFDFFWQEYGKQVDKKKSFEKFDKLELSEYPLLFTHVPEYVKSTPEIQYRKNPLTYLNGKCWNDGITSTPPPPKKDFSDPKYHD